MSKKVLCAIDGSDHSNRAIQVAMEIAAATNGELILFVVDQVMLGGRGGPAHKLGPDGAKRLLEAGQKIAAKAGCTNVTSDSVASYDVGRAVLNYAEDAKVDHIVVGTGDKGVATRLVVGSVSHDLVVRAHCSVTVAR
jgi:nucleotide-binding universal stress UspA family protein